MQNYKKQYLFYLPMDYLKGYRKRIDAIDKKIAKLLSLRFNLVKQLGNYKRINKIKVADKKRELQVIKNIKKYSNKKYQKLIIGIFKNIINCSKKFQK